MDRDDHWREQALCAQTDPEMFYPANGQIPYAAKRVCASCLVRSSCLADALARRDSIHGVLGGMTPAERRELLRRSTLGGER
jgi:WhiB family transcriptional regulator, redox-sensing transcriptional regulator